MTCSPGPAAAGGASGSGSRGDAGAKLGELVVTSDQDDSLVWIDGRFHGFTAAPGAALTVALAAGRHELVVSARARADLVGAVDVPAARRVRVEARFGGFLERHDPPPLVPTAAVGQTFRDVLWPRGKEGASAAPARREYLLRGRAGEGIFLAVNMSLFPVEVTIREDGGEVVAVETLKRQAGVKAKQLLAVTLPREATYRIAVRSTVPERATPFVLRVTRRLPDLLAGEITERYPGRRGPPPESVEADERPR